MEIGVWLGFLLLVGLMLALDLGVFNRRPHVIKAKEALLWSAFWILLSLLFNTAIYFAYAHNWLGIGSDIGQQLGGKQAALQFFTGYLVEKSLSLDNIFVIAVIFAYFKVPAIYQHRVLFWGIVGAVVLRGAMIVAGAALIARFKWMTYLLGGVLIATAVKMLVTRHETVAPGKNPFVRLVRRWYRVSPDYAGQHFFTRLNQHRAITPLFVVLLVIESTDVVFAIDSIPAIFAVTSDPFLVFTSNIFAILGLRSLYFALAAMMDKFRYLKHSLVFVLTYVGAKMILTHHYPIPTMTSLVVIASLLAAGMLASLHAGHRDPVPIASPLPGGAEAGTESPANERHA